MKKIILAAMCMLTLISCNQQQPKTMENQVINNILTRVSVRQFTGEPLTQAQVDTLLRAAMAAPSAVNKQPWAFVVISDKQIIDRIGAELPNTRCQNNAPLAIVLCGDLDKALEGAGRDFWVQDVAAATENLLLAAHSMGLGAVWTGMYPTPRAAQVQEMLGLPENIVPLAIVPVGYPAEQPAVKQKYNESLIHYNKW